MLRIHATTSTSDDASHIQSMFLVRCGQAVATNMLSDKLLAISGRAPSGAQKMDGYAFKDLLPLVAILGPIAAATITLLVTRRWQKAKRVTFWVDESEDLTLPLKRSEQVVVLEIGQYRGFEFNRSVVTVKNTGHAAIKDFTFHIVIPGEHALAMAQVRSSDPKLREAAKIDRETHGSPVYNPNFTATVPFLNQKEMFDVLIFFDKDVIDCFVSCRMEEVRVIVKRGAWKQISHSVIDILLGIIGGIRI